MGTSDPDLDKLAGICAFNSGKNHGEAFDIVTSRSFGFSSGANGAHKIGDYTQMSANSVVSLQRRDLYGLRSVEYSLAHCGGLLGPQVFKPVPYQGGLVPN